ncbi:helix-turn-helix domain-containing protein [Myxococcota bacterium]|nr:helix-turn-helix domain-containing protein [Myxococcota bacterium]
MSASTTRRDHGEVLTITELARELQVSRTVIRGIVDRHEIRVLIARADLDAYMRRQAAEHARRVEAYRAAKDARRAALAAKRATKRAEKLAAKVAATEGTSR